ncbi:MAG: L-threonylcarbamoyladenylate synthase [Dehalococcoidia bacterium]
MGREEPPLETRVIPIDPEAPDGGVLAEAGAIIRAGGLVAFPTETVYGLGANALDDASVRRIFAAKERALDDPLIVHLASAAELGRVAADVPALARELAAAFWPGPLTLVLRKQPEVPASATAGLDTVAVRVPAHPVALGLIRAAGVPIAAPSANRFTRTSATTAAHVLEDLGGRIEMVLDGGPTAFGVESSVVDVTGEPPRLLRPGALTLEALERVAGPLALGPGKERPASPGMMERHYAPRARLVYVRGGAIEVLRARVADALARGLRTGVIGTDMDAAAVANLDGVRVVVLGAEGDHAAFAAGLFAGMRKLDAEGVELVVVRRPGTSGLARAVDDRLRRAAAEVVE